VLPAMALSALGVSVHEGVTGDARGLVDSAGPFIDENHGDAVVQKAHSRGEDAPDFFVDVGENPFFARLLSARVNFLPRQREQSAVP